MPDTSDIGVLYTEYSGLRAVTSVASLWSFETCERERDRRSVTHRADGNQEYWLNRSDPLLNTILPGTGVSVIVNFGDAWTAGRSLVTSALLPRIAVVGPVTKPRILRVGRSIRAIGVVLPTTLCSSVLNVPARAVVDRILPLQEFWTREAVERLTASLPSLDLRRCVEVLQQELLARSRQPGRVEPVWHEVRHVIQLHGGGIPIHDLARSYGLSRQQFARRFGDAAGFSPKLFARITRFHALVRTLLSSDVSQWSSMGPAVGFYDQAHMINEFRMFAGSSPTAFFRPHDTSIDPALIRLRGRPSEWLRDPESRGAHLPASDGRRS